MIDAYSRRIVGLAGASVDDHRLVLDPVAHAFFTRAQGGNAGQRELIAHSDAGSRYSSVAFTQRLINGGIDPTGSIGDALDNAAAAQTTVGSLNNELICLRGPLGATSTRSSSPLPNGVCGSTPNARMNTPTTSPRGRRETPPPSQTHSTRIRVIHMALRPSRQVNRPVLSHKANADGMEAGMLRDDRPC